MSTFKIMSSKQYDGAMEVTVDGDEEVLKGIDMLALVREASRPASDDLDDIRGQLDDLGKRIGALEEKTDAMSEKLDRLDERIDRLANRLDRKLSEPLPGIQWPKTEGDKSTQMPYMAPDWVYRPSTTPVPVSAPNTSYGMPWETAPDEATRTRLWEYWHNPDGTPKLNCAADAGSGLASGLPPAPASFRGVDTTDSKPTGVKMTFVDGQLASCREVGGNGEAANA